MTSGDGIFMVSGGKVAVLRSTPYETEEILQRLLADFPEVLAGSATSGEQQGRLLLIRREKGVPSTEGGSATFSLDHLFVDSAGVPVLVEVKRSSDTRIRREVVGQMLDYAANGVKYWPVAQLRADFENACSVEGGDPAEALQLVAPDLGVEQFWQQVEQNLRSGRVRMVFVADSLPDELVRVIEFLNEQMSPAEVLGVEVHQYTDGSAQVLVPRLVGATSTARATKDRNTGVSWNAETFIEEAAKRGADDAEIEMLRRCFEHPLTLGGRVSWGKGITPGASVWYPVNGTQRPVWAVTAGSGSSSSSARLSVYFPELRVDLSEAQFDALVEDLGAAPAFRSEIASGARKYPSVSLKALGLSGIDVVLEASAKLNGGAVLLAPE